MYAVGLLGSGTVGLVSVSEPGGLFFVFFFQKETTVSVLISLTWGQQFEMLQEKTAAVSFLRQDFEVNGGPESL